MRSITNAPEWCTFDDDPRFSSQHASPGAPICCHAARPSVTLQPLSMQVLREEATKRASFMRAARAPWCIDAWPGSGTGHSTAMHETGVQRSMWQRVAQARTCALADTCTQKTRRTRSSAHACSCPGASVRFHRNTCTHHEFNAPCHLHGLPLQTQPQRRLPRRHLLKGATIPTAPCVALPVAQRPPLCQ